VSKNVSRWFTDYPHWRQSEFELRELRKKVTFAIFTEEDDMHKVVAVVDSLFAVLHRSYRP
jgi:type I restriction enzyme R subunit